MMNTSGTQRARLFVDGVGAPITANVSDRHDAGMVVRQPLPFLRLDTQVTDDEGQRARISHVCIAMHDGVPSLELKLENMADESLAAEPVFVPGVSQRPPRKDETLPYGGACVASREVVVGPPISASTMPAREPTLSGLGQPRLADPLADTIPAPMSITERPAGSLPPPAPSRAPWLSRLAAMLRRAWTALLGRPTRLALPSA